ncbi:MAG: alpha/beta hydrolase family protein [Isosphaeraceae bacterium]
MRRLTLALAATTTIAIASQAMADPQSPDDLTVLTSNPGEVVPGKRLYTYLEDQARAHFDARRAAVAALKTPDDLLKRQAELKAKFREALGELPDEKTPLNPRTLGRAKKDGYSVERVVYESRPGHHVTANFYLPEGEGPFPGVLVPCGHSANGKAAEPYQRISILLAKNGLASLCYDPIGQGERIQVLDDAGAPAVKGSTVEHTMVGVGAWLVGRSAAGYRVWDGIRSLDYLASRPEVDPSRLGCTGNSGGGTLTSYLMALDDRIAVAAPSCYVTSLERLFATIGPQDAEQNVTGQVALGIEHADYVLMRAPRPTLLCVGTRDYFDVDGSWTTFREVKRAYCALGHGERVDLFESDETHGFTLPRRQASMRWMRRWLLGKDDAPTEEPFPVASDAELQVTTSGQVLKEYQGVSAFDLNARRAEALAKSRADRESGRDAKTLREEVRERLAIPNVGGDVVVSGQDRALRRDGLRIDRWAITTEPGVTIPVLLFRPETRKPERPTIVYVGADRAIAAPGGAVDALCQAGHAVAIVEPRGTGETRPTPPGRGGYGHGPFGNDEREAFLSLHLNRPLLGQRVYDVLQALRAIRPSDGPARFRLVGIGGGGPVALHAALLADDVAEVELEGAIRSWTDVATTPISNGQLASVVPGVLESYDLPDLVKALAPRPVTIRSPVDPSGRPATPAS